MKKLAIGFLAIYSMSVWATAAQTPQPPAKDGSYLNVEKQQATNTMDAKLDNIEMLLSKLQNQLDTNTKDIENFKNKFDIFEMVKANNQVKIQNTELKQRYNAQVQHYDSLSEQLSQQKTLIGGVNSAVSELKASLAGADEKLASLNHQIAKGEAAVAKLNNDLPIKLQETNAMVNSVADDAASQFEVVNNIADDAASQFKMVAIGFGIAVLFIAGFIFLLRRRIDISGVHMEQKIQSTKASLEEKGLSLDIKLIEVLEKQLLLSQEQNTQSVTVQEAEPDHSLSLKVADEITRMQKNISKMDPSVKGLKYLTKGLDRIRKNFMANGYEIIDLLNKPYDDRMNIDVINYVDDPSLGEDDKVIVKVVRPQVNFNGVLIQRAQVDVAIY